VKRNNHFFIGLMRMHPATGQPPGNNEQEAAPSLQRFGNLLPPHYRPASISLDIVPSNITRRIRHRIG